MFHALNAVIVRHTSPLSSYWSHVSRRTRRITGGCGLLMAGLIVWHFAALWLAAPKHTPEAPVTVAAVEKRDITASEHTVGTVVSEASVSVTARVGGQIVAVGFKEGQMVHKGDLLFRLDPRPLKAALDQAEATQAKDRATQISTQRDLTRYRALAAQNAVSAQTLDQAEASAKAAAATVRADIAATDTARLNLEYAEIRSPVDGKTGAIAVQIGNLVIANTTTTLVTVTQISPIRISFALPQERIARIQRQMKSGKLTSQISVEGEKPITAPVDFIGNEVSATTGTIELRASYANTDARLVPGQMVQVDVALQSLPGALVVPHNAINLGPDHNYVFVVVNGKARIVPVTVQSDDGKVAAVDGRLKPGDLVITDGQLRAEEGKAVRIIRHGPGKPNATQTSPGAQ